MQPNHHDDDTWQQPSEAPQKAPYAFAADASTPPQQSNQSGPVVTLTPDAPPSDEPQPPAEEEQPTVSPQAGLDEPVRWQAKEYIHHEKNALWFAIFTVVVIGLMAAAIFLMNSLSFAILIPVMAAALLVYTHRPPRILEYTLSRQGLHINDHLYSFSEFKGFGVIRDGEEYSVMLIPTKRFRPGVVVYFPENAGEAIVDMLGARLPMQELHLDLVDKIVRKLRI